MSSEKPLIDQVGDALGSFIPPEIMATGQVALDAITTGDVGDENVIPQNEGLGKKVSAIGSATAQGALESAETLMFELPTKLGQLTAENLTIPLMNAFEPDEVIDQKVQDYRAKLKQFGVANEQGIMNVGDRITGAREELFGGGITEAIEDGGPLAAAGAAIGYLGGFNPFTKLPGIGKVLSGEAFEAGIAEGFGKLAANNPGLVKNIASAGANISKAMPQTTAVATQAVGGGAVMGTANTMAEIPFALSESIDEKGNFDPKRFGTNLSFAFGAGALLGGGGAGVSAVSKQPGFKEFMKKSSDYLKRKTRFYEARPAMDAAERQAQRIEENLNGGVIPEEKMAATDNIPDLFDDAEFTTEVAETGLDPKQLQAENVMNKEAEIAVEADDLGEAFQNFAQSAGLDNVEGQNRLNRVKEAHNNINSLIESKRHSVDDDIMKTLGELGDIPEFKQAESFGDLAKKVPGIGPALLKPVVNGVSKLEKTVFKPMFRTYSGVIEEYAPELLYKVRRLDRNKDARRSAYEGIANTFFNNTNKLVKRGDINDKAINQALQDGNYQDAFDIFEGFKKEGLAVGNKKRVAQAEAAQESLKQTIDMLDSIHIDLNRTGTDVEYRQNYWPRSVKDLDSLRESLDGPLAKQIENKIDIEADKLGRDLSKAEIDDIYTKEYVKAANRGQGTFKGGRTVQSIEGLEKHYTDYREGLNRYINRASQQIEDNKFLGKTAIGQGKSESVGTVINDLGLDERLSSDQNKEVKKYLQDYFYNSRRGINPFSKFLKDSSYTAYLTNIGSTMTQLADIAPALYNNGIGKTLGNVLDAAGNLRKKDGNLLAKLDMNAVIKDLEVDPYAESMLDKFNSTAMGITQFKALDALQKEIFLRGTVEKFQEIVQKGIDNPKNREFKKFIKKQKMAFGDDLPKFLQGVKEGDVDDPNVLFGLYNEMAEFQPISFSEQPLARAGNPDVSPVYALKTWSLRYLDALRKETWNQMKTDPGEGLKNLTKWAIYFGGSQGGTNMLKDYFYGREIEPEQLRDETFLQTFSLLNRYAIDKVMRKKDDPSKRAREFVMATLPLIPASTNAIFDAVGDVVDLAENQDLSYSPLVGKEARTSRYIPVIGKDVYTRWGRGKILRDKYESKKGTTRRRRSSRKRRVNRSSRKRRTRRRRRR